MTVAREMLLLKPFGTLTRKLHRLQTRRRTTRARLRRSKHPRDFFLTRKSSDNLIIREELISKRNLLQVPTHEPPSRPRILCQRQHRHNLTNTMEVTTTTTMMEHQRATQAAVATRQMTTRSTLHQTPKRKITCRKHLWARRKCLTSCRALARYTCPSLQQQAVKPRNQDTPHGTLPIQDLNHGQQLS